MRDTPLYNSRIIDNYIRLIRKNYSHVRIPELLQHAKMTAWEVADPGHWFTQEQINLFHERLSELTGNTNISREAGRFAASPEAMGIIRPYILGMINPAKGYELFGNAAAKFTKASVYDTIKKSNNKVEVTVTPKEGIEEQPFQCESRIGFLEAMTAIFTNKLPKVEHPECIFKGDDVCRYIISWESTASASLKKANIYLTFIFILMLSADIYYPFYPLKYLLPLTIGIILLIKFISDRLEIKELKSSISHLMNSSDELLKQIDRNYNNSILAHEVGQAIIHQTELPDILTKVAQTIQNRLDYERGMILLADEAKTALSFSAGFGFDHRNLIYLKNFVFQLDNPESRGIFVRCYKEQKSFLVNDVHEIEDDLSSKSNKFAKQMGSRSFICCPIISDGESIGILAVDNVNSRRPLVQSDMGLLFGIASIIGISFRNIQLLESKKRQFKSFLEVLAASIDARDPLTAGHSKKVTEYALGICNTMGLNKEQKEMIQVASLLHDYGKIGIPDAILMKPGKLTKEEYQTIQTHAQKTAEILNQVRFEGIFSQVPDIAGAHHEKVDGSGYPKGLKNHEIPFGARIIAVADVFEALTAKRHYRDPMPEEEALEFLFNNAGSHFDESVVKAFYKHYTLEKEQKEKVRNEISYAHSGF